MQKLSFVALWAPCLAQVSKKLHFPTLNLSLSKFHKYLSAATKPGPGVGAPIFGAGLLHSPCNVVPTRNCSADTSWVQSTENVRNLHCWFLRLPEFRPPLSAELPLLGEWPCHMAWSKHFEGYLSAFRIKVSFSFCLCCLLVVVWGKREILSLLRFRCSLDFFFFPLLFSLSLSVLLCPAHGQAKGAYLLSYLCPLNHTVSNRACHLEGGACLTSCALCSQVSRFLWVSALWYPVLLTVMLIVAVSFFSEVLFFHLYFLTHISPCWWKGNG